MSTRWAILVAAFLGLASMQIADAGDVEARPRQAANNSSAETMNRLGILYATGVGVSRDYVAALAWYRRAAHHGSTSAMNNIATMYFHGLGVPQSYQESVKWLRLAVQQHDAAAQNKLGSMYAEGLGVAKSAHDAFELFSLAAAQGHAPGMVNLGHAYASGSGVERDEPRAYALIAAALEIGVPKAVREAGLYELGALSQRLDAEQLERAQADARVLIETHAKASVAKVAGANEVYRL
jgi:uncharacterized protein